MKRLLQRSLLFILFNATFGAAYAGPPGTQDFTFTLTVPKNTCAMKVVGTEDGIVNFGTVQISKFRGDANNGAVSLPFDVTLSNCKFKKFDGNYVRLTGNYTDNDGFLDDPNKTFAVRISAVANAKQSDGVFVTKTSNKLWENITMKDTEENTTKRFYAYLMCKNGVTNCAADQNVGDFKATLTLTYIAD